MRLLMNFDAGKIVMYLLAVLLVVMIANHSYNLYSNIVTVKKVDVTMDRLNIFLQKYECYPNAMEDTLGWSDEMAMED